MSNTVFQCPQCESLKTESLESECLECGYIWSGGVEYIVNEWISVEKELPEDLAMIIYSDGTVSAVGRYSNCKNDPLSPMPSHPFWLPWERVIWWMLLPELPKGDEDE